MKMAISRNSFHYKYYVLLHYLWGVKGNPEEVKSLCVYSQFMFWMTILSTLSAPFMLMGWFILKSSRFLYKICSWTSVGRGIIGFLDNSCIDLGNRIAKNSDNMLRSPFPTLFSIFISVLFILVTISGLSILSVGGIYLLISYSFTMLICILGFLQSVSLAIFYICADIGGGICYIGFGVIFVAKYLVLAAVAYASVIAIVGLSIAILSLFLIFAVKVSLLSDKVKNFLGFKINGFHQARTEAEKRKKELERLRLERQRQRQKELDEIRRKKANGEISLSLFEKIIVAIHKGFKSIFSKTAVIKGSSVKVLSGIGVLLEAVKSIFHGVCPMLELIDEKDEKDVKEEAILPRE